jgi:membrane-associated protein
MDVLKDAFHWLLNIIRNPGDVIVSFGYIGMIAIIFIETAGLFPILPGDSLLVVSGIYAAAGTMNAGLLLLLLIPAAIAGDAVAYYIGLKVGPKLFSRPESRFFKPAYAKMAHDFYERHGGRAIIIARFVPIVRTYVPVIAGIAQMPYKKFGLYNIIGAAAWVSSMVFIGYFLGAFSASHGFPLDKHLEKVIIGVVILSLLPGVFSWWKNRKRSTPAS